MSNIAISNSYNKYKDNSKININWDQDTPVVCQYAAQENGERKLLPETTKLRFSRIHNSMIFYLMDAKVAVEVPAYKGRPHTKFEENCVNRFLVMSEQTFVFFSSRTNKQKIAITCECIIRSGWTLHTCRAYKGNNQYQFWCESIQQCQNYSQLFVQNKINLLTSLQGNHKLEQPENWVKGRFNIGKVPFGS